MQRNQIVFLKSIFKNVLLLTLLCCFFSNSAFAQRRKRTQTLDELIASLTDSVSSDSIKIRKLYTWVVTNIEYDYKTYMGGEPIRYQSPQAVYQKRKTTCTGYSNLLIYMLTKSGIPAFEVEGYTNDLTLGLEPILLYDDHSWVAFKLNGNWQVCDPTWDSGLVGFMTIEAKELKGFELLKQRIKSWKIWKVFWSKKRKKKEAEKAKKEGFILKKYSYKIGFIPQPKSNYLFQKPEKFSKTHLASIAHWQMNSAPLSIAEFCDSIHQLTDSIRIKTASFEYNALNDQYFSLNARDQYLWKADSIFEFNSFNSGDKCMNLNNYLNYTLAGKEFSKEQLDLLTVRVDSLNQSSLRAIRTIRQYNSSKKRELAFSFAQERGTDKRIFKSLTMMQSLIQRNAAVYAKGRSKTEVGDNNMLNRMLIRVNQDFELKEKNSKSSLDSLGILKQGLNLRKLADSISKKGALEMNQTDSLLVHFLNKLDTVTAFFYTTMETAQSNSYIDEPVILKNDAQLEKYLQQVNKTISDSLNRIFGTLSSATLLQQYDLELSNLKAQTSIKRADWVEDSLKVYENILKGLISFQRQIFQNRLQDSYFVETVFKQISPLIAYYSKCANVLSIQKSNRQKYLFNYLNMKVKRCTKAYTNVSKNGKLYKSKIKESQRLLKEKEGR